MFNPITSCHIERREIFKTVVPILSVNIITMLTQFWEMIYPARFTVLIEARARHPERLLYTITLLYDYWDIPVELVPASSSGIYHWRLDPSCRKAGNQSWTLLLLRGIRDPPPAQSPPIRILVLDLYLWFASPAAARTHTAARGGKPLTFLSLPAVTRAPRSKLHSMVPLELITTRETAHASSSHQQTLSPPAADTLLPDPESPLSSSQSRQSSIMATFTGEGLSMAPGMERGYTLSPMAELEHNYLSHSENEASLFECATIQISGLPRGLSSENGVPLQAGAGQRDSEEQESNGGTEISQIIGSMGGSGRVWVGPRESESLPCEFGSLTLEVEAIFQEVVDPYGQGAERQFFDEKVVNSMRRRDTAPEMSEKAHLSRNGLTRLETLRRLETLHRLETARESVQGVLGDLASRLKSPKAPGSLETP
ncbi:hypothetical protein DFH08DRAFT_823275 [Mycena albidolilacea]|uniref:Uncharacterized protein n=1 Tax=Mycena albidolilacea TaxID=1033008 RepID=A0AAD6Z6D7_9AGAR|nr:hypothetical protein DFH08DRAFT_823275 [Mycena albidolilacea]